MRWCFLMEEGLRRDLGEMEFQRARARRRVPTVLTMGECQRLFGGLAISALTRSVPRGS